MGQTLINALLFIVLLGTLVTVHEAGHFLTAKAFGIKVLRFSIGFGPKLFGFTWGETEYWVSALPLGGYVKMAGEDPTEELPEEDKGRGFLEQVPWKRAVVAFAGPAVNLIFPVVVFFFAYAMPTKDYAPLLASVYPDQPAFAAGLRPGDRITAIAGREISCFSELQEIISKRAGVPTEVAFLRGGNPMMVTLTPAAFQSRDFFGTHERGILGVGLTARSPLIGIDTPDSPAARAGLMTFDRITKVGEFAVKSYPELIEVLSGALSEMAAREAEGQDGAEDASAKRPSLTVTYVRSSLVGAEAGALTTWKAAEAEIFPDMPLLKRALSGEVIRRADGTPDPRTPAEMALGVSDTEMFFRSVSHGSPAWEAGLRPGDRLAAIQGKSIGSFMGFNRIRIEAGEASLRIGYVRDGSFSECEVAQKKELKEDGYGNRHEVLSFGAFGDFADGSFAEIEKVPFSPPILGAAAKAVSVLPREIGRTMQGIWMVFFSPNVSARSVGGPIAIYHATAQTAQAGAEVFLRFMGFISINLGLMNLLPIPILDGFHILSAAIETVRRRPLSENVRIILSYIGLFCLLALMILAFRNDVLNFVLR